MLFSVFLLVIPYVITCGFNVCLDELFLLDAALW
jgi:hypothetical protein